MFVSPPFRDLPANNQVPEQDKTKHDHGLPLGRGGAADLERGVVLMLLLWSSVDHHTGCKLFTSRPEGGHFDEHALLSNGRHTYLETLVSLPTKTAPHMEVMFPSGFAI